MCIRRTDSDEIIFDATTGSAVLVSIFGTITGSVPILGNRAVVTAERGLRQVATAVRTLLSNAGRGGSSFDDLSTKFCIYIKKDLGAHVSPERGL
jgi:hypothetical protein